MYSTEGRHNNMLSVGEGLLSLPLKLKTASEFDSFWMSTLNKAQVGKEGGREEGREGV